MEVYFGGAFQGKLEYVLEKKGCLKVADGAGCSLKDIKEAQVLNHLHLYIKSKRKAACAFFLLNNVKLLGKIVPKSPRCLG